MVSEMHIHLREGSLIWNLYVDEIPTELGKRALQEEVGDRFFGWEMTELTVIGVQVHVFSS